MSINQQNLKIALLKNKPDLSQSSIRTYLSSFTSIAKAIDKNIKFPCDFITHKKEIMDYLNTQKLSVKKSKLAGLISVLKDKDADKETLDCIKEFSDDMYISIKEYNDLEEEQEMSEDQKANYMSWPDILKVYERLKKIAEHLMKLDKEQITPDYFDIIMHYVLLSCYVLIPPRRALDYTVFKIRNFDDSEKSKDNYMVVSNRKGYFVFNSYKNSSKLGTQKIAIPNDLKNIILRWTKINDKDWLILSSRREKIQMNKINAMLQEIFKRKLGPSLLRHSFLTHTYGYLNLKKMKDTAEMMGSSAIETQLKYVDKSIAKEERGE